MDTNLRTLWETAEVRGAWHAMVHGVTESQIQLSDLITTTHTHIYICIYTHTYIEHILSCSFLSIFFRSVLKTCLLLFYLKQLLGRIFSSFQSVWFLCWVWRFSAVAYQFPLLEFMGHLFDKPVLHTAHKLEWDTPGRMCTFPVEPQEFSCFKEVTWAPKFPGLESSKQTSSSIDHFISSRHF